MNFMAFLWLFFSLSLSGPYSHQKKCENIGRELRLKAVNYSEDKTQTTTRHTPTPNYWLHFRYGAENFERF